MVASGLYLLLRIHVPCPHTRICRSVLQMPEPADARLLIYAPVPLHRDGERLLLEDQACNGMRLWAENFAQVTAIMPVSDAPAPANWVPIERIGPALDRIRLLPVPQAWTLGRFLRIRPAVRRLFRDEI